MCIYICAYIYICTKRQYSKAKLSFQQYSLLLIFIMTEFTNPTKGWGPTVWYTVQTTLKNSAPPHESSKIHVSLTMHINTEWLFSSSELACITALRTQTAEQRLYF